MSIEKSEERRLFVGGLSERITDEDLKKTFSRFGNVKEVAIKRKHGDSGAVEMFAFVNLDCVQFELSRCFSLLNNTKWKGSRIVVQLAKESYMDRLKREREAQQSKPVSTESIPDSPTKNVVLPKPVLVTKTVVITKPEVAAKQRIEIKPVKPREIRVKAEPSAVAIKAEPHSTTLVDISQDESKANILSRYATKKRAFSEIKRLESQQALVKMHHDRVQAISASLSNPDKAVNKKIKFDDEPNDSVSEIEYKTDEKIANISKGKSLFDESDNDDDKDPGFQDKPQFQGKRGEKLFKLQSSYNNDPRFALNEKFASDSESEEENKMVGEDDDLANESKKNLGILEQILGHQVSNHDEAVGLRSSISKKNQFKDFGFLRYDPKKSDAEKFIVKPNLDEDKPSKTKDIEPEIEVDLTDTNRFYDVSEDLSKALETSKNQGGQFKLLDNSEVSESEGSDNSQEYGDDEDTEPILEPFLKSKLDVSEKIKIGHSNTVKNSLEWGMKCSEDIREQSDTKMEKEFKPAEEEKWFFFRENDKRLEDGVNFFYNNGFDSADVENRWAERKVTLLRYMASRKKIALKKRMGAFVFNKNQQKRRQPQSNKRNSNKRRSNN